MEVTQFSQTLSHFGLNLFYTIVSVVVAITALITIDRYFYKKIDFEEEIKKGNMAAAVFYSVMLMFIAVLVSVSMN